jgi:hypothetical protein
METSETIRLLNRVFRTLPKPVSDCIHSFDQIQIYLLDPEGGPNTGIAILKVAHGDQAEKSFVVRNPTRKQFAVWAVDGCTILEIFEGELPDQRCDTIVFNDQQIAYIELKTNALSKSESAIARNRSKGTNQLLATIGLVEQAFRKENLNMPWRQRLAFLVTHPTIPKPQPPLEPWMERLLAATNKPSIRSSFETLRTRFDEIGVELHQQNWMVLN